jgi:hypothetical protein
MQQLMLIEVNDLCWKHSCRLCLCEAVEMDKPFFRKIQQFEKKIVCTHYILALLYCSFC